MDLEVTKPSYVISLEPHSTLCQLMTLFLLSVLNGEFIIKFCHSKVASDSTHSMRDTRTIYIKGFSAQA